PIAPLLFCLSLLSLSASTPISPLFPYTTLFRSGCPVDAPFDRGVAVVIGDHDPVRIAELFQPAQCILGFVLPVVADHADLLRFRDRKSTRLNSSHVKISYAVFRLKKKKTDLQSN